MKVTWRVNDGYIGNAEHEIIIDDSVFEDMDADEIENEIEEWVAEEFAVKVSPSVIRINDKPV